MRHRLLAVRGGESRWDGALHVMLQRLGVSTRICEVLPLAAAEPVIPQVSQKLVLAEDHMCALASDRQMHAQEREAREDSYLKSSL